VTKIGGTKLWAVSLELDSELDWYNKTYETMRVLVPAMAV